MDSKLKSGFKNISTQSMTEIWKSGPVTHILGESPTRVPSRPELHHHCNVL